MRAVVLVVVAVASLAFAPAPFPRSAQREGAGDDLRKLQGTWVRTSLNGKSDNTTVRVKGDRMQYDSPHDAWVITLDVSKKPKRIDFVKTDGKMNFRGVYRLEGDTFTYSLLMNVTEADRPLDFEIKRPNAWVGVYKRQKP